MKLKVDGESTSIKPSRERITDLLNSLEDGELISIDALAEKLDITRECLLGVRKRAGGDKMTAIVNRRICWGNLATIEYINSQKEQV